MDDENKNFIPPKNDRMFKAIFTENINCLKEFVSSLAGIPKGEMTDVKISNPELPISNKNSKMPRLDLVVELKDKIVNIEIQLCKTKDFVNRSLYYGACIYSEVSAISHDYNYTPQTICINVLDYIMFKNDDLYKHSAYLTVKETKEEISDKLQLHFFELPKISEQLDSKNDVKLWLQFLKVKSRKELKMVEESGNSAVAEAAVAVMDKNSELQKRIWKVQQKMAKNDEIAALYHAREDGKAEGIEQAKQEWINKIKNSGLPQEEIDKLLS